MSVSKWNWLEKCDGKFCCGDCDHCKNFWEEDECECDAMKQCEEAKNGQAE